MINGDLVETALEYYVEVNIDGTRMTRMNTDKGKDVLVVFLKKSVSSV